MGVAFATFIERGLVKNEMQMIEISVDEVLGVLLHLVE